MSELIVPVVQIRDVKPHPNADRLEIVVIDGWEIVSGKGNYIAGDLAVHVPPESMVPKEYADKWGVTPYLSFKGEGLAGRVKAARLRGTVSFGFLAPAPPGSKVGTDLREVWGIEKYEPPERNLGAGQMSSEDPLFFRYTNIGNLRNEVSAFDPEMIYTVTEKIHGTNSRVGWIRRATGEEGSGDELTPMVGTHRTQLEVDKAGLYGLPLRKYGKELNAFRDIILRTLADAGTNISEVNSIIVYGEIYGPGVQDMHYGLDSQTKDYRVFDVSINGHYIAFGRMAFLAMQAGLEIVPILFTGELTLDRVFAYADGNTTMNDAEQIREGIVIRPFSEEKPHRNGRHIFKVISGAYLSRKGGTENH